MHDDEEMVAAPLRVTVHELCHNRVNLFDNVHLEELFKLDLTRGHDRTDDLQGRSIEFVMSHLEVLKEDLNESKLFQDQNKGCIPLHNNREQFEAEQGKRFLCCQNRAKARQELA